MRSDFLRLVSMKQPMQPGVEHGFNLCNIDMLQRVLFTAPEKRSPPSWAFIRMQGSALRGRAPELK